MLLIVKDGNGVDRSIIAQSQATPTNLSGTIAATNVSQVLAPANPKRSGFLIQNQGQNAMQVKEIGGDAASLGYYQLLPLQTFPPCGYPVPTGEITIAGTADDQFMAREW